MTPGDRTLSAIYRITDQGTLEAVNSAELSAGEGERLVLFETGSGLIAIVGRIAAATLDSSHTDLGQASTDETGTIT